MAANYIQGGWKSQIYIRVWKFYY